MKVLIVEDNVHITETICDYLELEGITVDCAYNGQSAIEILSAEQFDAIVMDVMMPKLDGIHAVTKIRNDLMCATPIIFLTAKDTLEDKVEAFKAGGDDYLIKPFDMQELYIRIIALANRGNRKDIGKLTFLDVTYDHAQDTVIRGEKLIKLSRTQREILKILLKNAPNLVSRSSIEEAVWKGEPPNSDALRSHIYTLRTALDKGFKDARLETIHGQGYRLK